ncbi:response regulator containing a CheY-like receiver domain and an HTH DNA-binding domain [Anaerolinea thermolimosa]|nr:response regulator containing a CheY-like receiver domain and an HTH DNA-binding domain [Anaerolinea thermolimosa]
MFYYNDFMSLWERLRAWWNGSDPTSERREFALDSHLLNTLDALSRQTGISEEALANDLLATGLQALSRRDELWQCWQMLTPREQQVVALACLGLTNRQIASRMGISPDTVKTHLRAATAKFGVHTKAELNLLLSEWDFSAWV